MTNPILHLFVCCRNVIVVCICLLQRIHNRNYNNDLRMFLPRTIVLKRLKAADTVST